MSSTEESSAVDPENCFKILLASDIHLGYKENDEFVGNDSFNTFHEILRYAQAERVDFILLGGNLFHTTDPSKETLHKCMELLKEYALGDAPIGFEALSEHELNFDNPNINVSIPIFSIHGKLDDPSGYCGLSSMDVLQTSGLLNYFGKNVSVEEVNIHPILLRKGTTQVALYGLGHIDDFRLESLIHNMKLILHEPDETSGNWFNIIVLNQNRIDRGRKNFIPQQSLPSSLDFVLWGGESECRIQPEPINIDMHERFYVSQPGSTVVTSMSEGESVEKQIAILYVSENKFMCQPVKLETVRPFVYKSINLQDYGDELDWNVGEAKTKIDELLDRNINELIKQAKGKQTNNATQPKLPLIHLRVSYQNEDNAINKIRFGQRYIQRVANPFEMISMNRYWSRVKRERGSIDEDAMNNAFNQNASDEENDYRLQDTLDRYFNDPSNFGRLKVLFPNALSDMCRQLGKKKSDEDAVERTMTATINRAMDFLCEKMPEADEADIIEALSEYHQQSTGDQLFREIQEQLASRHLNLSESDENQSNDDENPPNARDKQKAVRGTSGRGRGRGRGRAQATAKEPVKGQSKGRGRGRGRGATRGNHCASPEPSTSNGFNASTKQSKQSSANLSNPRKSTRSKKQIVYDEEDSD
ncbi:double-strand break repair protein MRE11-like [Sitodiplosis mosellana]|uniref:double-strand break repair protein MRE11-like n=1 Tax=Sitodiplosis mosellana TaxID=263140 RepID=UPI002444771F|nr:double-strand break repair protein MRE11-like [Sitodiplosis mosellana]